MMKEIKKKTSKNDESDQVVLNQQDEKSKLVKRTSTQTKKKILDTTPEKPESDNTNNTNNNNNNNNNNHTHHSDEDDEENNHGHEHSKSKPTSLKKKIINFTLLFLMVPLIYSLPFILKKAGEIVASNRVFLIYIWAVYLVVLFSLVYTKRNLLSISSFVNQNLIWLIFTLGVFIVLDIPKMIQQVELRTEVLYVWITLTMIPNLIIFFFDDTDYKTQEKLEEEKEERKKKKDQERKARLDEKRRAKLDEKMKKYTPFQRTLINSAIYLVLLVLVALLGYQTYHWYLRTQRNIQERMKNSKSDYIHEHFDIED